MSIHQIVFLGLVLAGLLAFTVGRWWLRRHRLQRHRSRAFPPEWEAILEHNVALYRHLPAALREELHGHIQVFLGEKHFEGCGGLKITDEIRVTVAAQACILLLNRKTDCYPRLSSILVYPGVYRPRRFTGAGLRHELADTVNAGESWPTGAVVLAWDEVRRGAMDVAHKANVVLHEFAHQLDQEDGAADGAPPLERPSSYVNWARVLGQEYAALQDRAARGQPTLLDQYGATNPAEFFAVATETFFEQPLRMKREHPELYREMKGYYRLDPAEWMAQRK
jgi:MtfA peptidase